MLSLFCLCLFSAIEITDFTKLDDNKVIITRDGKEISYPLTDLDIEDRLLVTSVFFQLRSAETSSYSPNSAISSLNEQQKRKELIRDFNSRRVLVQYRITDIRLQGDKLDLSIRYSESRLPAHLNISLPKSDLPLIDKESIFICTGILIFKEKSSITNADFLLYNDTAIRQPQFSIITKLKEIKLSKVGKEFKKSSEVLRKEDVLFISEKILKELKRLTSIQQEKHDNKIKDIQKMIPEKKNTKKK